MLLMAECVCIAQLDLLVPVRFGVATVALYLRLIV